MKEKKVIAFTKSKHPVIQEEYRSWADELEQRGMEKGMEKGHSEERRNIASKMIKEGIPIEHIQKFTALPIDEIRNLAPNRQQNKDEC
jgi:predicted transposase/invertase (TIGR01784 family)